MSAEPLLYVAGVGRSGSTLLDLVLGNHSEVESVGELAKVVSSAWVRQEYCACGLRGHECPFWTAVLEQWLDGEPREARFAEYLALQQRLERLRAWPRLVAEARRPSLQLARYGELTRSLLTAIRQVSGRRVIVDSSKLPARAFALSLVPGVELRLLHLVRDPRGTAFSYRKAIRKDERAGVQHDLVPQALCKSALAWRLANSMVDRLRRRLPASLRLTYEDLVTQPRRSLEAVGSFANLDFSTVAERLERGEAMGVRHTIAGNFVRMKGEVRLAPDLEWRRRLSATEQRWIALLAGSRLGEYGYESRPQPSDNPGEISPAGGGP